VLGTVLLVLAQLWRIDRYGLLYGQHQSESCDPVRPAHHNTGRTDTNADPYVWRASCTPPAPRIRAAGGSS
jgi:hypothetical protein